MPSIEDILLTEVTANGEALWRKRWSEVVRDCWAGNLAARIDMNTGAVTANWSVLDDPAERTKHVLVCPNIEDRCVTALLKDMDLLNHAIVAGKYDKRSRPRMERHLRVILPGLIQRPVSGAVLAANPFPLAWRALADLLIRNVKLELSNSSLAETRLQNHLLLAAYFLACQLPEARLVQEDLQQFGKGMMSVRGSLARIVENISDQGVRDLLPPLSVRSGGLKLHHAYLSELLRATNEESQNVALNKGVLHRIVPITAPFDIPAHMQGHVTAAQAHQARDIAFRQYEYTILAYMALASIEQLLRSWASHQGVTTKNAAGRPKGILSFLDDRRLDCGAPLKAKIRDLYETNGSNVRNRIMHGGLLEVESKRQEVLLAVANPQRYPRTPGTGRDEYAPENICQICFECLELLDLEIAAKVTLDAADLSWVSDFWLTQDELELGQKVYCEFLHDEALKWQKYVSDYLNATVQNVKQFFTVGFLGWLGKHQSDTLVRFMAMVLVFEAAYRSVAQIHHFPTLQVSPDQTHVQYRMLDDQQLCSPEVLDALTDEIPPNQRPIALDVYRLAVKIRNALAHGGVALFDQYASDAAGHMVIKAVQGLVGGGLHQMNKVAAYYHWRESNKEIPGRDLENWLAAERQLLHQVAEAANRVTGKSTWKAPTILVPSLHNRMPLPIARRIGRNEACPCGSGKKFKRCCGFGA